jgi:integrin alpha FG-GAP repeat containing protein 1
VLIPHPSLSADPDPVQLASSTLAQPMVIDATGDLRPDLLGLPTAAKGEKTSPLKLWKNEGGQFTM